MSRLLFGELSFFDKMGKLKQKIICPTEQE
nr:MAG TPA: hypothetical protein [Caudoviricetes sp.]